jgi:NAD(P)-dependent dehydrogenase (short-subunit alcohol dehydrogenase family)
MQKENTMPELQGRVAVVTSGGRGIGKTIVHLLAQQGMAVGVNDVNQALAESVAHEFGAEGLHVVTLPGDISRREEVIAMVDRTEVELGPLWLMVNNAGVFNSGPTTELGEEAWDKAHLVAIFASDEAAHVTGQVVAVDGAQSLYHPLTMKR